MWFGSADGLTPSNQYNDENFTLTVTLSIPTQQGDAGVVFRMNSSLAKDYYFLHLTGHSDFVRLGRGCAYASDWTTAYWEPIENVSVSSIESNVVYELTIQATGTSYDIYFDGELIMDGIRLPELRSGSIGLQTSYSQATFYSVEYSRGSTSTGTGGSTPTEQPTTEPSYNFKTTEEDDDDATVLLSKRESFQPNGQYIGSYEMYENMHFEMDIEVHSFGSSYTGVLLCTNGSYDYYPRVMIHPTYSSNYYSWLGGFQVIFGGEYDWSGEAVGVGTTHHLEIDITRDTYAITQDGVIKDDSYRGHATGIQVDCYGWDNSSGNDPADVTVSNLLITTTGMDICYLPVLRQSLSPCFLCLYHRSDEDANGTAISDHPTMDPEMTTMNPTMEPSYSFMTSDADDNGSIPLEYLGWSPSYPLGECEGDCDSDSHCESGLVCYHRNHNDTTDIPPGCSGTPYWDADYCYEDGGSVPTPPTTYPVQGNVSCLFSIL